MDNKKNIPRLKDLYRKTIISEMMKKFSLENPLEVPQMRKIVINIGVKEAKENIKALDTAVLELSMIAGQKPITTRAKKSISNFKLREGMPIGCKVTLRGERMFEFLDRFISIAIPRIRDFRGINAGFDNDSNLNIGLTEQYIFPEVDIEKSDKARGMNITVVTNAKNNEQAKEMLRMLGMPFKKKE